MRSIFYIAKLGGVLCLLFILLCTRVFASNAEPIRCATNATCSVGEFLYDDTYTPITGASCSITIYKPDGSILFGSSQTVTGDSHGFYKYDVDTTGLADGLYPSQLCCTPVDGQMCLDKSFTVGPVTLSPNQVGNAVWDATVSSHTTDGTFGKNLQNPTITATDIWTYSGRALDTVNNIVTAIWSASGRSLDTFGSLIAGIWTNPSRTLTSDSLENGKTIATVESLQTATNAAVTSIKGSGDKDLTQLSTDLATAQTSINSLVTNVSTINTNLNTVVTKWGSYSMADVMGGITTLQTSLGSNSDVCGVNNTIFGQITCVRNSWGAQTADALFTAANNAATLSAAIRSELNYNGKSTTAYEDIQTLRSNMTTISSGLTTLTTNVAGVQTTANSIETKIDTLSTTLGTVSTNVDTLVGKWGVYSMSQLIGYVTSLQTNLGTSADICGGANTVFSQISCVSDKWGSQTGDTLYTAANSAATAAIALRAELDYNGKTTTAYEDLQTVKTNVASLNSLVGLSTDGASASTLFGKIKDSRDKLDTINGSTTDLTDLMSKWGDYSATDIYEKVKNLSSEISAINTVSNVSSILTLSQTQATNMTTLMNSVLSLQALSEVNRELLQQVSDKPIIKTWLENGSVVFRTLLTNPSNSVTPSVPLVFALPREAASKDVLKIDPGLKVVYNPQDEVYNVVGSFTLGPGETKIVSVEVQDIWKISSTELTSISNQANDLVAPLKNTSNFAQGTTLKADITAAIDHIKQLQEDALTPEARILAYREGMIELAKAKTELSALKELVNASGVNGNLRGFIGGIQLIGTWALIIVCIAGFVFMSIYFGFLMKGKKRVFAFLGSEHFHRIRSPLSHMSRKGLLILVCCVSAASTIVTVSVVRNRYIASHISRNPASGYVTAVVVPDPTPLAVVESTQSGVLGSTDKTRWLTLELPSSGASINVRSAPDIHGPIIGSIKKSIDVKEKDRFEDWILVEFESSGSAKPLRGWISSSVVVISP